MTTKEATIKKSFWIPPFGLSISDFWILILILGFFFSQFIKPLLFKDYVSKEEFKGEINKISDSQVRTEQKIDQIWKFMAEEHR